MKVKVAYFMVGISIFGVEYPSSFLHYILYLFDFRSHGGVGLKIHTLLVESVIKCQLLYITHFYKQFHRNRSIK